MLAAYGNSKVDALKTAFPTLKAAWVEQGGITVNELPKKERKNIISIALFFVAPPAPKLLMECKRNFMTLRKAMDLASSDQLSFSNQLSLKEAVDQLKKFSRELALLENAADFELPSKDISTDSSYSVENNSTDLLEGEWVEVGRVDSGTADNGLESQYPEQALNCRYLYEAISSWNNNRLNLFQVKYNSESGSEQYEITCSAADSNNKKLLEQFLKNSLMPMMLKCVGNAVAYYGDGDSKMTFAQMYDDRGLSFLSIFDEDPINEYNGAFRFKIDGWYIEGMKPADGVDAFQSFLKNSFADKAASRRLPYKNLIVRSSKSVHGKNMYPVHFSGQVSAASNAKSKRVDDEERAKAKRREYVCRIFKEYIDRGDDDSLKFAIDSLRL